MHELSLCQDIIGQVTELARRHHARAVASVKVRIGLLSGVEPLLLENAFIIARAGTVAEKAQMITETVSPRVICADCGMESEASHYRLRCAACGGNNTRLIQGDELILARVEMDVAEEPSESP